jgi:hypothetical protein
MEKFVSLSKYARCSCSKPLSVRRELHRVFTDLNDPGQLGPVVVAPIPQLLFPEQPTRSQDINEAILRITQVLEPRISNELCDNFAQETITGTYFWNMFLTDDDDIYSIFTRDNSWMVDTPECIMIQVVHDPRVEGALWNPIYPPPVLDVRPYLMTYATDPGPYDLWGVAVRSRHTWGNHIWAYVKKYGNWYRCDDQVCTQHYGALEDALRRDNSVGAVATMIRGHAQFRPRRSRHLLTWD